VSIFNATKKVLAAVSAVQTGINDIIVTLGEMRKDMAIGQSTMDTDLAALATALNTETANIATAGSAINQAYTDLLAKIAALPPAVAIDFTPEDTIIQAGIAQINAATVAIGQFDLTAAADDPGAQPAPPAPVAGKR
jgi:hypothetical protein